MAVSKAAVSSAEAVLHAKEKIVSKDKANFIVITLFVVRFQV